MVMLGTSLMRRRRAAASDVTRDRGRSRAPYPPTTVSLWTKPPAPLRSANTTRMSGLPMAGTGSPVLLRLRGSLGHVRGGDADAAGGHLPVVVRVLHGHLGSGVRRELVDADALGALPGLRAGRAEGPARLRALHGERLGACVEGLDGAADGVGGGGGGLGRCLGGGVGRSGGDGEGEERNVDGGNHLSHEDLLGREPRTPMRVPRAAALAGDVQVTAGAWRCDVKPPDRKARGARRAATPRRPSRPPRSARID